MTCDPHHGMITDRHTYVTWTTLWTLHELKQEGTVKGGMNIAHPERFKAEIDRVEHLYPDVSNEEIYAAMAGIQESCDELGQE